MVTQDEIKQWLNYDKNTGIFTWKAERTGVGHGPKKVIGAEAGWAQESGRRQIRINKKDYYAHRLAWLYEYGYMPSEFLDHIDGDPSNNRISNLREATASQNAQNTKLSSINTSGYRGVSWRKNRNKWTSGIYIKKKYKYLGSYNTPEEAYQRYLEERNRLMPFQPIPRDQ